MGNDVREVYARAWMFARAMPLLFLLPALTELLQHGAEIHLGMYASRAAFAADGASGLRLAFGYVKALAVACPTYWFVRYLAWGDARRAARIERPAAGLWLATFAVNAALIAWGLFGSGLGGLLGLHGRAATLVGSGASLIGSILGVYLTAWYVAWALGNAAIGPLRSLGIMAGSFWRTIGYVLACALPLMAAHYALGYGAIGRAPWLTWLMMAVDGGVVALLAHMLAGANLVAARHAARGKGVSLNVGGSGAARRGPVAAV